MEFLKDIIFEILVAGGGLAVLSKYFFSLLSKRNSNKFTNGLNKVGNLYDILQEAHHNLNCDRILILKTTNSGGIPNVSTPVYATILHEVYTSSLDSIKDEWQNRVVDSHYCQFLCKLVKERELRIQIKDLKGELKASYDRHNHKMSYVVAIKSTKKMFVYISFVFNKTSLNSEDKDIINSTTHKIRNIFDDDLGGYNAFK